MICKHCGSITDGELNICNTCRTKQAHINKLNELKEQMLKADSIYSEIRRIQIKIRDIQREKFCPSVGVWAAYWIISILVAIFCVTVPFIILAFFLITRSERNKRITFEAEQNTRIARLEKDIEDCYTSIRRVYEESNKFVSFKYSDLSTLDELINLMIDKRADNVKEALNLYEQMEQNNELMRMLNSVRNISVASAVSNARSAVANTITAINTSFNS